MKIKFGLPSFRMSGFPLILHPSSLILLAAALLLPGCGFHLRGEASLPFDSMYVAAAPTSLFAAQLKRAVGSGSKTRITETQKDAQVTLQILNEAREKQILSLSGAGRVSEYRLRYLVSFRLLDSKNIDRIPASEIVVQRDFAFNDQQVL